MPYTKIQFSPFPVKFSIWVKFKMAAKMAATSREDHPLLATFDDVTGPQRRTP